MRLPVRSGRVRNGVDVSMASSVGARAAALLTALTAMAAVWPAAAQAARAPNGPPP